MVMLRPSGKPAKIAEKVMKQTGTKIAPPKEMERVTVPVVTQLR